MSSEWESTAVKVDQLEGVKRRWSFAIFDTPSMGPFLV